ncbi:resolvase [Maritimibacter sp. DP1N21-5]|uniref:resolvase n=1 Tax=Maritimibacter sp. DP1N21-5 TaxID=2836867 RepID=UPI001C46607C|nr:resolvase [Maritimibacter sp. DP1N21-5]MBV7408194.1 resolvase [Maritimibacter sp. DP1N21-5]
MADLEYSGGEVLVDLFGNPVFRVLGTRGRPPFERTDENARKVSMLLAMGWSNERIAGVIRDPRTGKSISVPTLKRYFRPELQVRLVARDMLMARQLEVAFAKAEEGNVGAMKHFLQLVEKNDLMLAAKRMADDLPDEDDKPAAVGKKEAARRAALDAVSDEDDHLLTPGKWAN